MTARWQLSAGKARPAPPFVLFGLVAAGAAWGGALILGSALGTSSVPAAAVAEPASASTLSAASALVVAPSDDAGAPDAEVDAAPPMPVTWRISTLAKDPSIDMADGPVGHRTFLGALAAIGLSSKESYRLIRAFNTVHHFEKCMPKDTIAIAKDHHSGQLMAFEYATSPTEIWQARRNDDGELVASKLELHIDHPRVAVGVAVGDDLRASIVAAGLDDDMMTMLDDALDGHAELADVRPGARLRILATEDRIDGVFADYAQIEAIEYTPANPSAAPLRVYYFGHAQPSSTSKSSKHSAAPAGFFFDAKGRQPYHGGWRTPVPFARIASRFNPRRMHPVLHTIIPHNGVDFAAPPGTPIYAAAAGTVKSVGDSGPCGNMVQISHANGLVSAYCHMSRFAAGIHAGQHVDARQLVGYVGATGRVTGPHLHFAIKRGDVFMDPLALKLDGVRVVPLSDRSEFERNRAELDIALDAIPLPAALPAGDGGASGDIDVDGGTDDTVFEESP